MKVILKSITTSVASLAAVAVFASCAQSGSNNGADDRAKAASNPVNQENRCINDYHSVVLGTLAVNANGTGVDDVFVTIGNAAGTDEQQYTATVATGTFTRSLAAGVKFQNISSTGSVVVRLRGDRVIVTGETVDTMKCTLAVVDPNSGQ